MSDEARIRLRARPKGPAGRSITVRTHRSFKLAEVAAPAGWWRIVGVAVYGARGFDRHRQLVPLHDLERTLSLLCAAGMSRDIVALCRANAGYCDEAMLRAEGWSAATIRQLAERAIAFATPEVREMAA